MLAKLITTLYQSSKWTFWHSGYKLDNKLIVLTASHVRFTTSLLAMLELCSLVKIFIRESNNTVNHFDTKEYVDTLWKYNKLLLFHSSSIIPINLIYTSCWYFSSLSIFWQLSMRRSYIKITVIKGIFTFTN